MAWIDKSKNLHNIIIYVTAARLKTRDHHLPIKVRRVGWSSVVVQRIRRCRCCRARLRVILPYRRRTDHNIFRTFYWIRFSAVSKSPNVICEKKRRNNISILNNCRDDDTTVWNDKLMSLGLMKNQKKKKKSKYRRGTGSGVRVYIGTRSATVDRGDPWSDGADRSTEAINRHAYQTGRDGVCVRVRTSRSRRVLAFFRRAVRAYRAYVCERARASYGSIHTTASARPRWRLGGNTCDSSAAAVARPTQTPPRRRTPAPSVPPWTGPVGGACSSVYSASSVVGYPPSSLLPTDVDNVRRWLSVCGGGFPWREVGFRRVKRSSVQGKRVTRPCRSRGAYTS